MKSFAFSFAAFLILFTQSSCFKYTLNPRFGTSLTATISIGSANEIPNGERKIIDTEKGSVIVANIDGEFYAVNAKCPHLGLPMKKGTKLRI